jgi:hypothetical protein
MGYLVLQSQDEKSFDVIDGQQRLTTLTLIVLAALKNLQRLIEEKNQPEHNQQRLDQIRQTYIGYLDPVTLISRTKLTLNRNNDHYFQTYLIPLGHLPQRGFRASEHSLRKAFEWFDKKVRDYAKKAGGDEGFVVKKPVFAESQFELNRKIAEDNADWTPERIAARQKALAKLAITVWRVAQLS